MTSVRTVALCLMPGSHTLMGGRWSSVWVMLQCYDCYYTQDCATAPYSTRKVNLPSAMLNNTGVMDYFKQEFGFSPLEVGTQWSCIVTKSPCPGHRYHGRPHPGRCQHLQLRVARGVGHRAGGLPQTCDSLTTLQI